jgi:ribosomal-protein-alanine N-acetyltransferase
LTLANRAFLAPFEPVRPPEFWTAAGQRARILDPLRHDWLILDDGEPAGIVALSHVARGFLQSAIVSYWVVESHGGRGLASAAVADVVELAFGALRLHRLEAGTLVDNVRSQRVLEKNGFERFGLARQYLQIAGAWRDHVLFERIAGE